MKTAAYILLSKTGKPVSPLELRRTRKEVEYLRQKGEKVVKCQIIYDVKK